jgi:hypothetical protein
MSVRVSGRRCLLIMAARAHLDFVRQLVEALLSGACAGRARPAARERNEMSDCLHCEINQLVQDRFERGNTDLVEMTSMISESLADLILLAPRATGPV